MVVEWSLNSFLSGLESFGWYDVALPFVLVWVLVYAVLQKANIFGSQSKNFNMIISLAAAFLFIRNEYFISIMNKFLPNVSILLLVVVLFLAIVGLFGGSSSWRGIPLFLVMIVAGISIWWAFASSAYGSWVPLWARISPATQGYFIVVIVIVVIGVLLYSSGPGNQGEGNKFRKTINNMMEDFGASSRESN